MKAYFIPALMAIALSFLLSACGPPSLKPISKIAVCEGKPRNNIGQLRGIYPEYASNTCKEALLPFDLSAWIEAPLNSHRQRGLNTLVLGCANLTPNSADCSYGGNLGHSSTLHLNYDMTRFPDTALVQKATLAVHVRDNSSFFAGQVALRGRLTVGDTLQSLAANRISAATTPGWVLFDITNFAARAINEKRNSVHFELSLPCGRSESELVTVSLLAAEPRLILEFK
jgi:hypothetical protein